MATSNNYADKAQALELGARDFATKWPISRGPAYHPQDANRRKGDLVEIKSAMDQAHTTDFRLEEVGYIDDARSQTRISAHGLFSVTTFRISVTGR